MELEAEAAFGETFSIWNEHGDYSEVNTEADVDATVLRSSIPYFGRICISRSDARLELSSSATIEQGKHALDGNNG